MTNNVCSNFILLIILDDQDEPFKTKNLGNEGDNIIHYWFTATKQEEFAIRVTLDSHNYTKYFRDEE